MEERVLQASSEKRSLADRSITGLFSTLHSLQGHFAVQLTDANAEMIVSDGANLCRAINNLVFATLVA